MDISREELDKIVNDVISRRFNNIGIYDNEPEHLEITRANFVFLNAARQAREESQGAFRRVLNDVLSNAGGQALWVIIAAACVWATHTLWK